jgi:hypothetical protein
MWYRLAQARTFAWLTETPPGYAGRVVLEASRSGDVLVFEEMLNADSRRSLAVAFPQGADQDPGLEALAVEMLKGRLKTVKRRDQNKHAEAFYNSATMQSVGELLGEGYSVRGKQWTEVRTSSGPMSGYCWLVESPWGLAWFTRLALLALSEARTSSLSGSDMDDHPAISSIDLEQPEQSPSGPIPQAPMQGERAI